MFLLATLILGACQPLEAAPPPTNPIKQTQNHVAHSPVEVTQEQHDAHVAHGHLHGVPPGAIVPRATIEDVEPAQEALARAIVAAAKPSLDDCRANSGGGKLRLRVVGNKSSAKITIDPSSNVNDAVRNCVLEALSTVDVPDTLSQGSPSMRPSAGFTSIIAVNW